MDGLQQINLISIFEFSINTVAYLICFNYFFILNVLSLIAWLHFNISFQIKNSKPWNPDTIEGTKPKSNQDSFMYRVQNGVKSVLLDDDNCDCLSSLSFGHGLCGTGQ